MNRIQLQQLAEERLLDADALLLAGRWSSAYYPAGYAVECGLKACVAKLINQHDFPDKELTQKCYTHKIDLLVEAAQLGVPHRAILGSNLVFRDNWLIAKDWNEAARYELWTESEARELFAAITDTTNGIMSWVRVHW